MLYNKAFQEALQSYYESHDFTGKIPAFDAGKYTPAQTAVYLKAKNFFSQAWLKLLPDIGNKRSMKNFSPDYPLNCLKDGDAAYIADAVTEIFFDEEQFDDALDFFFSTLQEPLEVGLNACAKAHGKEVDDLSDDEIADVVGKLTDLYMEELVHALMVAQKAPEIYTALHSGKEKLTAHGDFNQSVKENHDKINFDKRWMHSGTKLGEALSLEQVAKNNPEVVAAGTDYFLPTVMRTHTSNFATVSLSPFQRLTASCSPCARKERRRKKLPTNSATRPTAPSASVCKPCADSLRNT